MAISRNIIYSSNAETKTAEQFASGEFCYLLNGADDVFTWRQNLETDASPVLDNTHGKVYASYLCPAEFSNTKAGIPTVEHDFQDGICTVCGAYENEMEQVDGIYQLKTMADLYWFAEQVNNGNTDLDAVLANDITVNTGELSESTTDAKVWTTIGNYDNQYTGTFDGQGHIVNGLYFNDEDADYVGLSGYVGEDGSISNVGVENSYFNGYDYVGGVCGENDGTITNCYNIGEVSGSGDVGGVCGYNNDTINNCYNIGTVSASGSSVYIGGVCGYNNTSYGTITNCYYLTDTAEQAVGYDYNEITYADAYKDKTAFHSGEVAYRLASGKNGSIWGQDLTNAESYPALNGAAVYRTSGCIGYSNSKTAYIAHTYDEDGICTVCGAENDDPMIQLTIEEPAEFVYTGEALVPEELVTADSTGAMTFTWKSGEDTLNEAPAVVGEYELTVSIPATRYYTEGTKTFTITITKAEPKYNKPSDLIATYGDTLADVELPDGFTWQDEETTSVGNAGENTFQVKFTPEDTANYNVVKDIAVTIDVAKAEPEYDVPVATATYGQTLKDVELPEGFSWQDDDTTSVGTAGEHTFKVTFTPEDTANYNVVKDIAVTIDVAKAEPEYTVPVATATYGQTLKDVELPEGFAWQDEKTTSVGNAGEHTFKATFTPKDTANYNIVEDIEVTINVGKADPTVTPTIEDKTYSEGDDIPAISTSEKDTPGTIKWLDLQLEALEAGENTLTWEFTPTDEDNYNAVTGTIIVVAETTTATTSETETSDTETETSGVTEISTAFSTTTSNTTTSKVSFTTTSSAASTTTSETATSAEPTNTTTSGTTDITSKTTETTTSATTSETVTSAGPTNTTTSDTTATTSETTTSTTTIETATSAGPTTSDTTVITSETTTSTTTSETATSAGPTNTTTSDTTTTTFETTTSSTTTTTSGKTTESTVSETTTTTSTTVTTSITTDTTTSTKTTSATISATTDTSETTTTSDTTETTTDTTNTTDTTTTTTDTTTTTETEEVLLKGDANGDGIIDADDAYVVLVYYAEKMVGKGHTIDDPEQEKLLFETADIDQDGDLDEDDAYLILLYYARVSVGSDVTWEDLMK